MPNDLADWTISVNVAAGTVTIGNTPAVTISGTPTVSITGTVSIAGSVSISSGTVTATVSGAVTITSGTVTVTAIQRNIVVDDLGTFALTVLTTVSTESVSSSVADYFQGIQVHLYSGAGDGTGTTAIRVTNTTKGITSQWQTVNATWMPIDLFFPVVFDAGDALTFDYVGPNSSSCHVHVFGLGEIPPNVPRLRPDGRLPSVGTIGYTASTATGTTIATVAAGWRALVRRAYIIDTVAAGNVAAIQGTVNGVGFDLAREWFPSAGGGPLTVGCDDRDGVLCDAGQNITAVVVGGTTPTMVVLYDIVR